MAKNKKWSSAAKFEIALQAIKNETTLNEICKKYEVEFIIAKHFSKLGVSIDESDFSDQEAVSTIIRMTNGNFRLINRLLKQSQRIMHVNCMTALTTEILEAARKCLLIGER